MLKALTLSVPSIDLYADVEFSEGLTVITGESGTGKSLFLEAISHIFGQRTPRFARLDGYTISALLDLPSHVVEKLREMGYVSQGEKDITVLISKRERTIYRLNGVIVSLDVVSNLLRELFSYVSVDERTRLKDPHFRRNLVDTYVNPEILTALNNVVIALKDAEEKRESLNLKLQLAREKFEDLRELEKELSSITGYLDEYEKLLSLAQRLRIADEVLQKAHLVKNILKDDETSIWHLANTAEEYLNDIDLSISFDPVYDFIIDVIDRVDAKIGEYEDMPMSLEEVESIIWKIQRLMRKYDTDIEGLKVLAEEVSGYELHIRDLEKKIREIDTEIKRLKEEYGILSNQLSQERKKAVDVINNTLAEKGQGVISGNLYLTLEQIDGIFPYGNDVVDVIWDTGKKRYPVYTIASSGELSRLLLLLYAVVKPHKKVLLFDEIDAGTSGQTAMKVASLLRDISRDIQVIVTTHSQFVAASGDTHLTLVTRGSRKEVKIIEGEERLLEIARLVDGGSVGGKEIAYNLINSYKRGDKRGEEQDSCC